VSYTEVLAAKDLIEQRKLNDLEYEKTALAGAEADERAARVALAKVEFALRAPVTLRGLLALLRYREEMARDGYDLFDDIGLQRFVDSIQWCLERELGA
jgi:hypothetical protein